MRKALICIAVLLCGLTSSAQVDTVAEASAHADTLVKPQGGIIAMKGVFLAPRTQRDSVLIGDQLMYGVEMRLVEEGTQFAFPEWKNDPRGGITAVSPWLIDTVQVTRQKKGMPRLLDIKGQIRYPVTVAEVLPWAVAGQWAIVLVILGVCLYLMFRKKGEIFVRPKEPAHIVALRELDKYRGKEMWEPSRQKAFYSGITDALREYISERYGVGAMEMTTSEIFDDMKKMNALEHLPK